MTPSNLKISRITQAGSRAKKTHRPDTNSDIIFSVSKNPDRINFYPKLIEVLKNNFSHEKIYLGSNYNAIHLDFRNREKFDIVLLSENEFDKEYKSILDYKRKYL